MNARLLLIALVVAGCAAPPVRAPVPAPEATARLADVSPALTEPAPSVVTPPLIGAGGPATAVVSQPLRREPVFAADSLPDGLAPLRNEERDELATKCKPLSEAIAASAKKNRAKSALGLARAILENPPKIAGVDVPRCSALMIRELDVYRARAIESEAVIQLKRMSFGMASAFAEHHALCPSAPAVPASQADFTNGTYVPKPDDWNAEGWTCLRFEETTPQHYQYELRSDPEAFTYEAIARGVVVKGFAPSELFVRGRIDHGELPPNSDVMRR